MPLVRRPMYPMQAAPVGAAGSLSRLQQGTYGTGGEVIDKTYYDTLILDSTANVYRMFTQPEGQGTPVKTKDLTNMVSASQISQGQNLTVKAIQIAYISDTPRNTAAVQLIYDVINHFTAEVVIPGKDNLGDWTFQELFGACFMVNVVPTAAGDNLPLISPQFNGIRHLKVPIVLSALTTFEVRVTPQVASDIALDGDYIRIGLRGILRRSS